MHDVDIFSTPRTDVPRPFGADIADFEAIGFVPRILFLNTSLEADLVDVELKRIFEREWVGR